MLKQRALGNTGVSVTRMGLGLAALGRPGYINLGHAEDLEANYAVEEMELRTHQVLDDAFQAGIRYFDAARSYGKAEAFLSSWLAKHPERAGEITLSSKWGYRYTANWAVEADKHEVKEHTLPVLIQQWLETRELLNGHVQMYQIHSATLDSGVLDRTEVLNELARMREEEGLVIGLSVSGKHQPKIIEKALSIERDGRLLFGNVQATFNVLEPSAGPMLAEAHRMGLGVVIKEGLANGRLTARNSSPNFGDKMRLLAAQAAMVNTTVDALALGWVLHHDFVDTALSGAATPEHLQSNLKALHHPLSNGIYNTMSVLQETPDAYWATRSSLAWN